MHPKRGIPKKHGHCVNGELTPEYIAWEAMLARCYMPSHNRYHRYGGRGIKVCERWRHDFAAFFEDMGERPSPQHSLDRYPNKDGNYELGNVRWANEKQQQRNRSNNFMITHAGKTLCIVEWADRVGIKRQTIAYRLKTGWSAERALTTPTMTLEQIGLMPKRARDRSSWKRGEEHPTAKLTWNDVNEIRARAASGATPRQLADDYSMSIDHIRSIIKGKSWAKAG